MTNMVSTTVRYSVKCIIISSNSTWHIFFFYRKEELDTRFEELSCDKDGKIKKDDIVQVLVDVSGFTLDVARYMVGSYDTDGDNKIDKAEYKKMWQGIYGWDMKETK